MADHTPEEARPSWWRSTPESEAALVEELALIDAEEARFQAEYDAYRVKRPLRSRIWFRRPTWYFSTWRPMWTGGDEYDWHTLVIGWNVTGQIIMATRRCPGTGKCAELGPDQMLDPRTWDGGAS